MRLIALCLIGLAAQLFAQISKPLIPFYAKSTIAIQEHRWQDALSNLEQILKENPQCPEALELKALALTELGKQSQAKTLYLSLLARPLENGASSRHGLYAFELGKISYHEKNYKEATAFLTTAINSNHNPDAAHFLIGKMYWEQKDWANSMPHFKAASTSPSYRSLSQWYLSQALVFTGRKLASLEQLNEAKDSAQSELTSHYLQSDPSKNLRQEIITQSEKELSHLPSPWVAEVGVATGYDSNVLFSPNASDSILVDTEGSIKQTLNWRLNYSPLRKSQLRLQSDYQGSVNYNFNQATQSGQFFLHSVSNVISTKTSNDLILGFKIGGTGALQFRENNFRPFSLSGSFGPIVRVPLSQQWWLNAESFFQPIKLYQDSLIGPTAKRSGWDQLARLSITPQQTTGLWSPSVFVSYTLMRPSGQEFKGNRINLDIMNSMMINATTFAALTAGLSSASYPDRSLSNREDHGLSAGVATGRQLSSAWLVLAQLDWMKNDSTDNNFQFQRWTSTVSGSYRF